MRGRTATHEFDFSTWNTGVVELSHVLVIGAGKAGSRFLRSFNYLQQIGLPIRLVGICDVDPIRLAAARAAAPTFLDVREALRVAKPTVVCVCVNEVAHHEVLEAISVLAPQVRLVLCEKPLTENLEQFVDVEQIFPRDSITVNFVERYSPIVSDFISWREKESAAVFRAEFFWGKYRLRDSRPTMGVLSEISHAIDLIRALTGMPETTRFEMHDAWMTKSDFSCLDGRVADSVSTVFTLGATLLVCGHASFLWEERRRHIVLYSRGHDGSRLYQAVLRFDDPRWDQDRLTIYRLDDGGTRSVELETYYTNSDFPAELDQVFKVTRFVHESLRLLSDPTAAQNLVTVSGAKWVQEVIEEIGVRTAQAPGPGVKFGARR